MDVSDFILAMVQLVRRNVGYSDPLELLVCGDEKVEGFVFADVRRHGNRPAEPLLRHKRGDGAIPLLGLQEALGLLVVADGKHQLAETRAEEQRLRLAHLALLFGERLSADLHEPLAQRLLNHLIQCGVAALKIPSLVEHGDRIVDVLTVLDLTDLAVLDVDAVEDARDLLKVRLEHAREIAHVGRVELDYEPLLLTQGEGQLLEAPRARDGDGALPDPRLGPRRSASLALLPQIRMRWRVPLADERGALKDDSTRCLDRMFEDVVRVLLAREVA